MNKITLYDILLSESRMDNIAFAVDIYRSLCNNVWYNSSSDQIIRESWRSSASFVADIRNERRRKNKEMSHQKKSVSKDIGFEDYISFYLSGDEGTINHWIDEFYKSKDIFLLDGIYLNGINPDDHIIVKKFRRINSLIKLGI
jgi:hypothetical protein